MQRRSSLCKLQHLFEKWLTGLDVYGMVRKGERENLDGIRFCHILCPMAGIMNAGQKIRNLIG